MGQKSPIEKSGLMKDNGEIPTGFTGDGSSQTFFVKSCTRFPVHSYWKTEEQ